KLSRGRVLPMVQLRTRGPSVVGRFPAGALQRELAAARRVRRGIEASRLGVGCDASRVSYYSNGSLAVPPEAWAGAGAVGSLVQLERSRRTYQLAVPKSLMFN